MDLVCFLALYSALSRGEAMLEFSSEIHGGRGMCEKKIFRRCTAVFHAIESGFRDSCCVFIGSICVFSPDGTVKGEQL